MGAYIELKPSYVGLTDSVTGDIRNIKLHDGHLWLETTTGIYIQLLDNYTQDSEANKPAAGIQGRWFYATDSAKMCYDNGTAWQEILNKAIYFLQDTEANKPAAGIQDRWFYATDSAKMYYDNGTAWQEILNKTIYCLQDTEANKPTAGIQNRWFYSTDTAKLYYDNGTAWQEILNKAIYFLQDTEANKPAAGIQGRWFYATDSTKMYYDNGTDWYCIAPKVTEIDITTTCQQVTISGLNFNKYKKIQINGSIYNPSGDGSIISLCCNDDITVTNYYSEMIYSSSTTIAAQRYNNAKCCFVSARKHSFFNALVSYDYNNIFRALSKDSRDDPSAVCLDTYSIAGSSNVTNITKLNLISSAANSIGAGSKIFVKQG